MPVYKRAARPTAARYASADPRPPQSSENEFTVLYGRMPARMRNFVPSPPLVRQLPLEEEPAPEVSDVRAAPVAPEPPVVMRKRIERPSPAPRLPVAKEPTAPAEDPVVPRSPAIVAAVPAVERIQTVVVPPRLASRVLRVTIFLALGTVFGLGIELGLRSEIKEPWETVRAEPRPPPPAPVPAPEAKPEVLAAVVPPSPAPVIVEERASVTHATLAHHHGHRGAADAPAAPGTTEAPTATDSVAAVAAPPATPAVTDVADDFAAAEQTLSKAKAEVMLP